VNEPIAHCQSRTTEIACLVLHGRQIARDERPVMLIIVMAGESIPMAAIGQGKMAMLLCWRTRPATISSTQLPDGKLNASGEDADCRKGRWETPKSGT